MGVIPLLGMSCSIMTMHKCDEPLWLPDTCMLESWWNQSFIIHIIILASNNFPFVMVDCH